MSQSCPNCSPKVTAFYVWPAEGEGEVSEYEIRWSTGGSQTGRLLDRYIHIFGLARQVTPHFFESRQDFRLSIQ